MKPHFPLAALALGLLLAGCAERVATGTATAEATDAAAATRAERKADLARGAPAPVLQEALAANAGATSAPASPAARKSALAAADMLYAPPPREEREQYQHLDDNPVQQASAINLSTLSLDVDTGSYSNVRRFLNGGRLPPRDAVRVEELVNYFPYGYPQPAGAHPFAFGTEVTRAPWNPQHLLLRVGVKAVEAQAAALPPANLVFLVDVSGSMNEPDKLPLVQSALQLLVNQLRPQDRVALVVYAGRTAVELRSTPGSEKDTIRAAIARLSAGGSTAGEAALRLAYAEARAGYIRGGINRILLATDGDFNVGISDLNQIKDIVARERESGISLTTLGFGTGNYQEALMEQIADVGNGNYSYIDSLDEARKVLVDELSSTFHTVAKDVKVQVEFNPAQVAEWRLIGYENRVLRAEDFRNDKVDAAEVGAGKSVTALYEITPVGAPTLHGEPRYTTPAKAVAGRGDELAYLRVRYKQPRSDAALELGQAIARPDAAALARPASRDLRFASAVAAFGQLLRQSPYTGTFSFQDVRELAQQAVTPADAGYRQEFLRLVALAEALTPREPPGRATAEDHPPAHGRHHRGDRQP
ncbi:MAG TPA: VWA domain-containing protein [Moraxellaceae bacterium]|nr:VWA domain-containing protein [Moraxellaceae bacterium]